MKKTAATLILLVFLAGSVLAQAAPDPSRFSVGSRVLGMGKAFVAMADDVTSIFMNPAGLANVNRWQMTSMQGKLLDEFSYLTLSGVYPTNFGKLGMGFAGSSIGGAFPTRLKAGSDADDPIYEIIPGDDLMSYYNNVFLLSYGGKAEPVFNLPFLKGIGDRFSWIKNSNVGANLKIFTVGLAGDGITEGNATGTELDLGFQARPNNWLRLGGNLQNILPVSFGGKLEYASGWTESYPAVVKLGLAANLIGPQDSIRTIGNHEVIVLVDADWEPTRPKVPTIFHMGAEWTPLELITIRAGIDQEMVGVGEVANNLTMGLGLNYRGFRFDYAYHQFAGAPGIDNHFFSLSYGIFKKLKEKDYVKILEPKDKLITKEASVNIKVKVVDPEVSSAKIMNTPVLIKKDKSFSSIAPLKLAKNTLWVEAFEKWGKLLEAERIRALRLITYPDVPSDYWAAEQISYIGTLGIIKGYPDGLFKPEGNITRAELATLLMRTRMGGDKNVPESTAEIFTDVPSKHWALKYVNLAAQTKVVKGYPDGSFKPNANVTRAEGLTMIARFAGVTEETYAVGFRDISRRHWASSIIAGSLKEGLLQFLKGKPFEPNRKLLRAEAVEILYRSRPIRDVLLKDLLDFKKGYEKSSPAQKAEIEGKKVAPSTR